MDGLCGSPDPLDSPGLRLYGPHGIHRSSDLSETGSDGPCRFPDPLGSPGLLVHSGLPLPIGFFGLYVSNKQPIPLPWTVVVREPRLELVTASLPWRAAPGPGFVEKEAKVLLSCGDADIIVVLKALLCYFPYARHIVDR